MAARWSCGTGQEPGLGAAALRLTECLPDCITALDVNCVNVLLLLLLPLLLLCR